MHGTDAVCYCVHMEIVLKQQLKVTGLGLFAVTSVNNENI